MTLKRKPKHIISCTLIAALLMTAFPAPAAAESSTEPAASSIGNGVSPTCDEAYYAMLDYYGNLTDGSVVKSYRLNGATRLIDYGNYDSVNNLTDGTEPQTAAGRTTFDFGENPPENFYFEGKTKEPFDNLPWTISMSYRLNGVPTKAEDLSGKTGVVEINLDLVPNDDAADYVKNNYTLEAMALFNQDEILSLEAEGGQVQLIGNIRMVLFMCMPGEENHFTIRVGSDDFTFSGMVYMMAPATLSQLDMLSDLSKDKDDIEDDYRKLSDSLDVMLNAMGNMTGSLRASADGLEQLNGAVQNISDGTDVIYDDIDLTTGDLSKLAEELQPAVGHLQTVEDAIDRISGDINALTDHAVSMKTELAELQRILNQMNKHLDNLRRGGDGDLQQLKDDLDNLGDATSDLQASLRSMRSKLNDLKTQVGGLSGESEVTVNGMTVSEIRGYLSQAEQLHAAYEAAGAQSTGMCFEEFITAYLLQDNDAPTEEEQPAAAAQAAQLNSLYEMNRSGVLDAQLEQADAVNSVLASTGMTVSQLQTLMNTFIPETTDLLRQMEKLCEAIGSDGLTGTMTDLLDNSEDLFDDMSELTKTADTAITKLNEALDLVDQLNATLNGYIPETKDALSETEEMLGTVTGSLDHLTKFLKDLKKLLKDNQGDLTAGTNQSLTSMAASLREMAASLSTTDDVKAAKNNVSDIIEELWNDHTGDADLILNMDPDAESVSLTSSKNDSPSSVQVLIRTEEIKKEEAEDAGTETSARTNGGSLFSRIAQMFHDIWNFIRNIF